jgi:hypothetical protein
MYPSQARRHFPLSNTKKRTSAKQDIRKEDTVTTARNISPHVDVLAVSQFSWI